MSWIYVIMASIVEGLTEFLPVSSTGHLIILNRLLKIEQSSLISSFNIFIQAGAILAVINQYKNELTKNKQLILNLVFSFLPTMVVGLTLYPFIKEVLLGNVFVVSVSLIVGGLIILFLPQPKTSTELNLKRSFIIGIFQSFSIIPGLSRALMAIIGGLVAKQTLKESIQYSFLLAIPTIVSATILDLYQSKKELISQIVFLPHFIVGFFLSYFFAKIIVSKLIKFISDYNNFIYFGYYRIALGLIIVSVIFLS